VRAGNKNECSQMFAANGNLPANIAIRLQKHKMLAETLIARAFKYLSE